MTKAGLIRLALIAALLGMLEVMVRIGRIDPLTMQAPHNMVIDLYSMLASGKLNKAIAKTMGNAAIAWEITPATLYAGMTTTTREDLVACPVELLFIGIFRVRRTAGPPRGIRARPTVAVLQKP